ncbi:2-phosphosulfolactate phosphatase [Limnochorda pilosa]|uniref:Probable 2-phosphosulfolactate phosphatase n=1 Tax=Limnochorda pilosa TaxID=1555112 RepID=A0A0K2SNI9_LIMPI|nr:2-phosphosulfolactate phosphatase [Limnochorda pilosa]BAS28661.1 2-phosphosulfolactate phosphatase [Limnochorda pilosa]
MKTEVALRAEEAGEPDPEAVAVVVDVLRATTWVATALERGAWGVRPVPEVDEAFRLAAALREQGHAVLLAGERGGLPLPGFDLGNSPAELTQRDVAGRRLVLTTTNGTRALGQVASAGEVLVASLRNAGATALYLAAARRDVHVVCAGTRGRLSLEDVLAAGWLVRRLREACEGLDRSDGARVAEAVAAAWEGRELEALRAAEHGRRLLDLGFGADLEMAARKDAWDRPVRLEDGWLRPVGAGGTMPEVAGR